MKLLLSLSDQSFHNTKSVGIFNVSMGLAKGLMHCPEVTELHILGNNECAESFRDCPPQVHVHLMDMPVPSRFSRVAWDQWGVCRAIRRIAPDWALLPKGFPPYFPRIGKSKLACYLHDVNWEYYEKLPAGSDSPFPKHQLIYFRRLGLRALEVSDLLLTSSDFNCSRYLHYAPQARVAKVGIGFDGPAQSQLSSHGRDILFYASPYPHKLSRLGVQRLNRWLGETEGAENIRIHVIGRLPQGLDPADRRWILHGRLPQEELQRLMQEDCRLSVYFSDYEGFGMPPVESLRAGLPCVASDLPPIRENIPADFLFRNDSEESFLSCMENAYHHSEGKAVPAYPTWQEVAQRCVAAMKEKN